ncbi:MAG: calcium/sodium antiporter [Thermodesulfobacteriota bacterium]|nr:calcium/sodium antiporter [Thermodesulfobacteriota bacterium]
MVLNVFLLCLGIALLYSGSEWMVKGAASLALSFSIRPVLVGLTVVAFATSAPELLVSLIAAVMGSSGVSLGNILGSNVANIGLVLGASAMARTLTVDKKLVRREIPFMVSVSGLFWVICLDGRVGRIDGIILLAGLAFFLILGIKTAGNSHKTGGKVLEVQGKKNFFYIFLVLVGMVGLVVGAHLIVDSAIFIARRLGLSEIFIGLSIVAVGTSLPELATSVVAGLRGEHDLSIGNIVGSNVFNICMVMGTVGLLNPMSVDMKLMAFEFPAMLLLTLILLIFARTGSTITRAEGFLFTLSFFLFVGLSYWLG